MTIHNLNIDANPNDADWTKRTWDLPKDPEFYFMRYGMGLKAWMADIDTKPAGKAMPKALRSALTDWIAYNEEVDRGQSIKSVQAVIGNLTATLGSLEASVETKGLTTVETKRHSFVIQTKTHDDVLYDMITEIKTLLDGFTNVQMMIEMKASKRVMHVRTEDGVRKFGLPIGAVVVGHSEKDAIQLAHIFMDVSATDNRKDGLSVYKGSMNKPGDSTTHNLFLVGKGSDKKWHAKEVGSGKIVADGKDEMEVLTNLNAYNAEHAKARYGKPVPVNHGSRTIEEIQKRKKVKKAAHRATGDDILSFGIENNALVDIFIFDKHLESDASWGFGYNRKGIQVPIRKQSGVEANEAKKAQVVDSMDQNMPAFDKAARHDMQANTPEGDTALACYLMKTFGMRVGTSRSPDVTWTAYGATQILKEHVKISGNDVHLQVPSKKGGFLDRKITDHSLAMALKKRMTGKHAGDRLLDTTDSKTTAYIKPIFGKDMKNHRLRGWAATAEVSRYVEGTMDLYPHGLDSEEEFLDVADQIAQAVGDEVLFDNKVEVFKSYVNPDYLLPLAGGNDDWMTALKDKVNKGKMYRVPKPKPKE